MLAPMKLLKQTKDDTVTCGLHVPTTKAFFFFFKIYIFPFAACNCTFYNGNVLNIFTLQLVNTLMFYLMTE